MRSREGCSRQREGSARLRALTWKEDRCSWSPGSPGQEAGGEGVERAEDRCLGALRALVGHLDFYSECSGRSQRSSSRLHEVLALCQITVAAGWRVVRRRNDRQRHCSARVRPCSLVCSGDRTREKSRRPEPAANTTCNRCNAVDVKCPEWALVWGQSCFVVAGSCGQEGDCPQPESEPMDPF